MRFVNGVINDLESKEHDPVIPSYLLKILNHHLLFNWRPILLWKRESTQKTAKEKYDFRIVWKTKKTKQLSLWRRKIHILNVSFSRESVSVKENYTSEANQNYEHGNWNKDSEAAKYLSQHVGHVFQWKVLKSVLTKKLNNIKKLNAFTKEKYDFRNVWKIKKTRQLFQLKKKNKFFM